MGWNDAFRDWRLSSWPCSAQAIEVSFGLCQDLGSNIRKKTFNTLLVCPCVKPFVMINFQCPLTVNSSSAFLHLAVLDVYVLSTDGQVQDFKFPQSSKSSISIQLSANTVKLNSRNGKLSETYLKKKRECSAYSRNAYWIYLFDFCSYSCFCDRVYILKKWNISSRSSVHLTEK